MKFGQIWPSRGSRLSANGPGGPPSLSENKGQDLSRAAMRRDAPQCAAMRRDAAIYFVLKVRTKVKTPVLTVNTESVYKQEK